MIKLQRHRDSFMNNSMPTTLVGIDEAGRGCLAGPVVAAAVVLPLSCTIEGLDDSKKLSEKKRIALRQEILAKAHVGIGLVWQKEIDKINILQATFHAMTKALRSLYKKYAYRTTLPLYIDGNKTIPLEILHQYSLRDIAKQYAVVGGDASIQAIGAASIVAKTQRDYILQCLHRRWPEYNFAKHKGYGTKEHKLAIEKYGPCPLHRMTFAPLNALYVKGQPAIVQGTLF